MSTLSFQPVTSIWIILIFACAALLMLFVRPSFANINDSQRKKLNLLRSFVVLMALLGLMRPGCVQTEEKLQAGVMLFLLDISRSMQLPHIDDNSTRWDTIKKALTDNQHKFQKLAEKQIETRFFGFDNLVSPIEFDTRLNLPKSPEGGETDIGTPIFNSTLETRGERLIGVFLASDGVQTVLNPAVEISQAITPLVDMETPLFSIPLGSPADTGQIADVSIKNFAEQHVVNVKNKLSATATIVSRGYRDQDIRIELVIIDSLGREKVVDPPTIVTPTRGVEETNVEITYKPTEPGEYRMKIRAVPMPGELALRNNELDAFLTVNDKGLSVAFIDGGVAWEQSYLRRSLASAEFIDLTFVPIYPSEIEAGSQDLEELFSDDSIDVFILSNVSSRLLYDKNDNPNGLQALHDAVTDRGKGLMMMGGYHSFGPGLYHSTPLAEILPIKMSGRERQDFNADIRRELHIVDELTMKPAQPSEMTNLGEDAVDWSELPPLVGANRFAEISRNGTVILESNDAARHPLMVASAVNGRVLAFAGDSLWRWNLKGIKKHGRTFKLEYDRFWRQIILWLSRAPKDDESISIDFPQRRFLPRGRVRFGVKAQSVAGEELNGVSYAGTLIQPDGQKQIVSVPASGEGNWNEVDRDMLTTPGVYMLEIEGQRDQQSLGTARRQFVVMDRDIEKSNPVANIERMTMLANQTRDFGGKVLEPAQLGQLLDELIANPPVEKIQIPTRWRFGETKYDSGAFLILFVLLLAAEWILRKKWGLV